jgi:cell wall-associated NlpC family hydrolase
VQRTTSRRRTRAAFAIGAVLVAGGASLIAPATASADPTSAADALALVQQAAQELTVIDEQVHAAELTVAAQQETAAAAAEQAAAAQAALAAYEPQLRAIAQSGYTGTTQSRVAAFLTSDSAGDLVQQIATIDLIADHTNGIIAEVAAVNAAAEQAQAAADQAAATARAGLVELEAQQAAVQEKADDYQADFARLSAAEQARVARAIAGPALTAPSDVPLAPTEAAATAVQVALSKVGAPYVHGGSGPNSFDCSGLTMYAYAAAGVALPHSSAAQSNLGRQVSRSELQPGDLVFYYTPISHVALYIGNGMIVHARTYGVPLSVTSVDQGGYRFATRIVG